MATTNGLDASGNVNEKDGLLDQSVKEVDSVPNSEPKPADIERKGRVDALWEEMNKGVSNKTLHSILNKSKSTVNKTTRGVSDNWMMYLGLAPKGTGSPGQDAQQKGSREVQNGTSDEAKTGAPLPEQLNKANNWAMYLGLAPKKTESLGQNEPQKESSNMQNGTSDEAKRLAAAALSAVKDAAAAALVRGKVEITEVRDFAGKDIEVKKLVDADSKEASDKGKASASSAVDALLEQIRKKPKLSVLDKTKKDWGEFKEENRGLEDELDAYKKSSNQYLDKVSFLQRTDYREFERERDVRLALQSKRRSDMREEP